jgi:hypothetical protein
VIHESAPAPPAASGRKMRAHITQKSLMKLERAALTGNPAAFAWRPAAQFFPAIAAPKHKFRFLRSRALLHRAVA